MESAERTEYVKVLLRRHRRMRVGVPLVDVEDFGANRFPPLPGHRL